MFPVYRARIECYGELLNYPPMSHNKLGHCPAYIMNIPPVKYQSKINKFKLIISPAKFLVQIDVSLDKFHSIQ